MQKMMTNKLKLIAFLIGVPQKVFICGFEKRTKGSEEDDTKKKKRHKGCALTFHFSASSRVHQRKNISGNECSIVKQATPPHIAIDAEDILIFSHPFFFCRSYIIHQRRVPTDDPRKAPQQLIQMNLLSRTWMKFQRACGARG